MSGETPRELLEQHLTPLLPSDWAVLPYQANLSTIDRVVVVLKHNKITKLPEAPMGTLANEFTVTVASPKTDMKLAEEDLDDAVLAVVTALDASLVLDWSEATKVKISDKTPYIGWDITVTLHTQKAST